MHSFFTLRRIAVFGVGLIVFFTACTRISSTDIGAGLLPTIDGVDTKDTLLDVITDSFDDPDTLRVYYNDINVLGSITNDPLFGKTQASMFLQMGPSSFPFYIPGNRDSIRVDSAVLILGYAGVYGDSTSPLRLHVYEVNTNTPIKQYFSYPANYPAVNPISLGAEIATPVTIDIRRLKDSVNNRYENAVNQVRIPLNNSIATRFIKTYDSTREYKSDSLYNLSFAGFGLTADAGGGANALIKVNLLDSNTKFALYYSTSSGGATKRDTSVSYFVFNSATAAHANFITRNRSGGEISNHLTTTSNPDSLVYVQTSPGTYVRVKIPGLQGLSNRIIHRAELICEQVPDDANLATIETQMLPPRYLLLSRFDSSIMQKRNIPNDYYISSTAGPNISTFGGYVTSKAIMGYNNVASYNFDLSRYVQGIVTRKDSSFTLRLSAPVNDSLRYSPPYPDMSTPTPYFLDPSLCNQPADGRVRLGGGTHSRFRMRLHIVFSRI
jgi:hypothetical protein